MVGARQRRNWGPVQFEVVKDNKVVASGKAINDISADYAVLTGPKFRGEDLEDPEENVEEVDEHVDDSPTFVPPPPSEPEVLEPEVVESSSVNYDSNISDIANEFKATKRQIQAKLRFHKYCPPSMLLKLNPNEPTPIVPGTTMPVIEYVGQMREEELLEWMRNPAFWAWFVTDDDVDADIYEAKKKASSMLLDVLEMDDINPETGLKDMKIMSMKLRVAESILNKNKTIKVENKTLNVKNVFNTGKVPKQLASADMVTLEQRLAQIKENDGD